MLLKIGMAERGECGCTECIALVMRTILNRVHEEGRFGSSIKSVLFAQDQFTPVMDGTYYSAEPNDLCREALEMVIYGWDESQGALYYEWCEGESWHSKNLHLLFQHCDTRFYD
jgi:N-acetylmuramoyl-L-alanine amidase